MHFHGENSIPGCREQSLKWCRIGPMFILLIFWAVNARIFDIFVKRVGKLARKVFSVLKAIVDLFSPSSEQIHLPTPLENYLGCEK